MDPGRTVPSQFVLPMSLIVFSVQCNLYVVVIWIRIRIVAPFSVDRDFPFLASVLHVLQRRLDEGPNWLSGALVFARRPACVFRLRVISLCTLCVFMFLLFMLMGVARVGLLGVCVSRSVFRALFLRDIQYFSYVRCVLDVCISLPCCVLHVYLVGEFPAWY